MLPVVSNYDFHNLCGGVGVRIVGAEHEASEHLKKILRDGGLAFSQTPSIYLTATWSDGCSF